MKEIMPWFLRIQLTVTWINLTMANQTVINSLKTKMIESPQMNFVFQKRLIKFSCTYQLLSFCKIFIKKIFELIQSYEHVRHFWGQNSPFVLNNFFLYKPLLLLSSTYGSYRCAKLKRNLTVDSELWRCTIFRPKVVHLPQIIFFFFSENLLMSLVFLINV